MSLWWLLTTKEKEKKGKRKRREGKGEGKGREGRGTERGRRREEKEEEGGKTKYSLMGLSKTLTTTSHSQAIRGGRYNSSKHSSRSSSRSGETILQNDRRTEGGVKRRKNKDFEVRII